MLVTCQSSTPHSQPKLRKLEQTVLDTTWKGPSSHFLTVLSTMSHFDTSSSRFLDDHERVPLDLLSGLPSWSPPSSAVLEQIVEPIYNTEERESLRELRNAVADKVSQSLTPSKRLKQAYGDFTGETFTPDAHITQQ